MFRWKSAIELMSIASLTLMLTGAVAQNRTETPAPNTQGGRSQSDRRLAELTDKCGTEMIVPGAIAGCLQAEEKLIGKELERNYRIAIAHADNKVEEEQLRQSQRAWLQYQATFCKFVREVRTQSDGISLGSLAFAQCNIRLTLERSEDLRAAVAPW